MQNSKWYLAISAFIHAVSAFFFNVFSADVYALKQLLVFVMFASSLSLSVSAILVFGSAGLKNHLLSRGPVGGVSVASKFMFVFCLAGGFILFLATGAAPVRCDFAYLDGCYSSALLGFSGAMMLVATAIFLVWVVWAWLGHALRR